MSIIPNTNIAIDFFTLPKKDPGKKYIYFLTHMHSGEFLKIYKHKKNIQDHYYGLSSNWDYGPIYCSEITKKVCLIRFPNITQIVFYMIEPMIIFKEFY